MEEKLISPAEVYRKIGVGEPISDEEISLGIEHFGKLAEMLQKSGAEFSITAAECIRVVETLTRFMQGRWNLKN